MLKKINDGIFLKVNIHNKVSFATMPANGFGDCGADDFMVVELTKDGISPKVVGITLAEAKRMAKTWITVGDGISLSEAKGILT